MRFAKEKTPAVIRLVAFCLGVLGGAVAFGAALGALGGFVLAPGRTLTIVLVAIVALFLAHELAARHFVGTPGLDWQVPKYWLLSRWRGYAAFGVVMGVGLFTVQRSILYFLFPIGCLASGSGLRGAVFGLAYALTYLAAFGYGSVAWHRGPTGGAARGAAWLLARARIACAVAAPLILLVPS